MAHAHFQMLALPVSQVLARRQLGAALHKLGSKIWRVKGFLPLRGEDGLFLLQYTAGKPPQWELAPHLLPSLVKKKPQPVLVFIGPHLDHTALLADFFGARALAIL